MATKNAYADIYTQNIIMKKKIWISLVKLAIFIDAKNVVLKSQNQNEEK